ncbi:MAG TPA: site-2 protease family protein [Thermoanaerobaculia bacterium]|nr:site-2 protease family protein [Thermoanaerobaculia bacterium]
MQILSNILAFLVAAGVVIFVHEAGHYLVAKLFRVRVLTFSLGFGKRIWGFRKGDTDYRVSVIPLGGYVSFAGQDPTSQTDDPAAFLNHPRWQRVLILLAGPAMNVVLAILLVAAVFMIGTEMPNPRDISNQIGQVAEGSPAAEAGLRAGDRIVAIDGGVVSDWRQVTMEILTSPEQPLEVEFERDGELGSATLVPREIPKYELGEAGIFPAAPPRIRGVNAGSPAERAGLRYGDAPLLVDGRPIATIEDFQAAIEPNAGREIDLVVDRLGERVELTLVPEEVDGKGLAGVVIGPFHFQRFGPIEALRQSVRYNVDTTAEIFAFIGKIFERRISAQSALGGPIEIAAISGAAARTGFTELILFMGLISLNLFILNMLPVPVLDGGQILILLVESTLRRDLSVRIKERMIQVGLVLIVLLMGMALYFDLMKNLPIG